jgi:hypothetical protein
MNGFILLAIVVVGVPLALILVLGVAGLFIRKRHTATRSLPYAAPADAVWAALTDWPAHPQWRAGVRAMERLPDRNGHPVWRDIGRRGGRLTSEVVELDPQSRRMVTRIVDEAWFGGAWTWQVVDGTADGGSVLTITEDGEIYNPLFRAVGALFFDPRATIDSLHRDLRAKLGEPAPVFVRATPALPE